MAEPKYIVDLPEVSSRRQPEDTQPDPYAGKPDPYAGLRDEDIRLRDKDIELRPEEPVQPREKVPSRSMESLDKDQEWLKAAKIIFEFEKGEPSREEDKDISKWFKRRHARLGWDVTNLGLTALSVKDFNPAVKRAWVDSLEMYDSADPNLMSAWRALSEAATDPVAAGIGVISLGTGAIATKIGGRAAAIVARQNFKKQLIKQLVDQKITPLVAKKYVEKGIAHKTVTTPVLKKARKEALKISSTATGKAAMLPGATYMGLYDLADQTFKTEMELQEEFDPTQLTTSIMEGAVLGWAFGKTLPQARRLFTKRAMRRNDDAIAELERLTKDQTNSINRTIENQVSKQGGSSESQFIDELGVDTQRSLKHRGTLNLTIKGPRVALAEQRKKKGLSKQARDNLSIEEITSILHTHGIELIKKRGAKGRFIGKKVNEHYMGGVGIKRGTDLGLGEVFLGKVHRGLSSDAGLGREGGKLLRAREAGDASAARKAKKRIKQADKAAKEEFGVKHVADVPEDTLKDFNNFFKGNAKTVASLAVKYQQYPKTLKVLGEMRKDLQFYQKDLLTSGAIKPVFYKRGGTRGGVRFKRGQLKPDTLYYKIAKSIDGKDSEVWINRQYRMFDDPKWKQIAFSRPDIYGEARAHVIGEVKKRLQKEGDDTLVKIDDQMADHLITDAEGITQYDWAGAARDGLKREDLDLHMQYFDPDSGYVRKLMDDILDIGGEDEMFKIFGSSGDGALGINKRAFKILTPRGEIPKAIRAFMGEYEDPFTNYANSYLKLNSVIETYRYEKGIAELAKAGLIPGISTVRKTGKAATTELKSRLPQRPGVDVAFTEGMGAAARGYERPLSGLYGNEIIADAVLTGNEILHQTTGQGTRFNGSRILKNYLFQQGLTRTAKVLYSISAYPRNFMSAGMMAFGAGYFRPKHVRAIRAVFKEMVGWSTPALRAEIEKMAALGIHQSGIHIGATKAVFQEAAGGMLFSQLSPLYRSNRAMSKKAADLNVGVAQLYQSMDDMWKYFAFLNEKNNYNNIIIGRASRAKLKQEAGEAVSLEERKLLEAWRNQGGEFYDPALDIVRKHRSADGLEFTLTRLDELAADKTLQHMQNYASVSQYIKYLRRLPFADFFSYTSELARTQYNILRSAKNEILEGNELAKLNIVLPDGSIAGKHEAMLGYWRLMSTVTAQSSAAALSGASASWAGGKFMDAFTYIQSFGQDYEKGSYYLWLNEPKEGAGKRVNISYVFPWANLHDAVASTIRGIQTQDPNADWEIGKAVFDSTLGSLYDMMGPSMWAEAVVNVVAGYDDYGKSIYKEGDVGYNVVAAMKEFWKAYEPTGVKQIRDVVTSYTDRPEISPYDFETKDRGIAHRRGKTGRPYKSSDQWMNLAGIKPEFYDIKINMGHEIGRIKRGMADAGKIFTTMVQEKSPINVDELVDAYTEALELQVIQSRELYDVFERAKGAGVSDNAIINKLTEQGLYKPDKEMWNRLVKGGRYIPPRPITTQIRKWALETKRKTGVSPPVDQAQSRLMDVYNLYMNYPIRKRKAKDDPYSGLRDEDLIH